MTFHGHGINGLGHPCTHACLNHVLSTRLSMLVFNFIEVSCVSNRHNSQSVSFVVTVYNAGYFYGQGIVV